MKPILLVRNDPVETFGLAVRSLEGAGATVIELDAADPSAERPVLADLSGVVMHGGTMNVDEIDEHPFLKGDRDLARECVARAFPYLGICLGAQILARAMDMPVFRAPVKEVGFEPVRPAAAAAADPLLSVYGDGDPVFQWHQDTMDLPAGAELLASGDRVPIQAYRVGNAAWGIQFHFEVDAAELEYWLEEASAAMDIEEVWGKSADAIRQEATRSLVRHEEQGGDVFARFARFAAELEDQHDRRSDP
ncbi:MAG: type 1 glutamine amidotransferase [Actinomycetota bacterium]|nr:type 1 glutamine amidotransferase [Actinomycetota bacterium]